MPKEVCTIRPCQSVGDRATTHAAKINITWEWCHSTNIDRKQWQQQCCLLLCFVCAGGPQTPSSVLILFTILLLIPKPVIPSSLPVYSAPPAAPYTGQLQVSLQHQPVMTIVPHSTHTCFYMLRVQLCYSYIYLLLQLSCLLGLNSRGGGRGFGTIQLSSRAMCSNSCGDVGTRDMGAGVSRVGEHLPYHQGTPIDQPWLCPLGAVPAGHAAADQSMLLPRPGPSSSSRLLDLKTARST